MQYKLKSAKIRLNSGNSPDLIKIILKIKVKNL
jgi:hypothetical protein